MELIDISEHICLPDGRSAFKVPPDVLDLPELWAATFRLNGAGLTKKRQIKEL
jgi:hypothetical protein